MSIEKEYGRYTPACDTCFAILDPCDTFQDAVDECRENDWSNVMVDGIWQNMCPKCHNKYYAQRSVQYKLKFLDW